MSIFLKPGQMKVKDENGDYTGVNVLAEESAAEYMEAMETKAAELEDAIETKGEETLESIPDDYSELSDAVDELNERLEAIEEGGAGESVPKTVRQAIFTILSSAVYAESGLTDELEIVEEWSETHATAISLSASTLTFNGISSQMLTATLIPADSSDNITWSSSNSAVATVNDGEVTSAGNGTCTITATAGSVSAMCTVTVSGISATYSITNNLTNCTNSNPASTIVDNGSYSATISASGGYALSSVTVTMGGVDITSTAYSDGDITIQSATGNIVITAVATASQGTLIYNWDFLTGLTDSVQSSVATLYNGVTQDSTGLHFTALGNHADFPQLIVSGKNRTIEIDVTSYDRKGTDHGRFLMWSGNGQQGLIYRKTGKWALYLGTAWTDSAITSPTAFNGKTVRITTSWTGTTCTVSVYLDDNIICSGTASSSFDSATRIGSNQSNCAYNLDVTALRVYEEE